ncbi:MAG: hypothetical protein J6P69_05350 [Bacteroidales bacterium]|nr:hypothetical protein [Bacteroidales bacterium]
MIDSTNVIRPASQAFTSGTLEMSERFAEGYMEQPLAWADYPVNTALLVLATLLLLISLRIFIGIAPKLFDSLTRWKACVNIDASVQLKNDRNTLAVFATLPMALVADRYHFFSAGILDRIPEEWSSPVTLGIIVVWLLIRHLCFYFCSLRAPRPETFRTAHKSFFNYWILATLLLTLTAGVIAFTNIPEDAGRTILLYELAVMYLIALLRKSQILLSYCGPLTTFLYLCALEFIPTGALIAGCILL